MKILDKILGGIFPTGKRLTTDDTQVDNEIQNVILGAGLTPTAEVSLTGTASSVGTAITGVGTLFLTELKVGDLFYKDSAQNDLRRVTNIASNLALTVESAFASDFSAQACSIFNVTQLFEAIALMATVPDATTSVKGISRLPTVFRAVRGAAQSVPSGVLTKMVNDIEEIDTDNAYNTSLYRFTAPNNGYYFLNASAEINAISTGKVIDLIIKRNGTEILATNKYSTTTGLNLIINITGIVTLASGDYVEAFFKHTEGSNLDLSTDNKTGYFNGHSIIKTN